MTPMLPPDHRHEHGTRQFEDWLFNKWASTTDFDPSELEPRLIPFFGNEVRIQLAGHPAITLDHKLFGIVGVTVGPRPCFVITKRAIERGSSDVLLPRYFDEGLRVVRTKLQHEAGTYKNFIESPRYLEIVAWYQLTLKIPRPIQGKIHDETVRNTGVHQ